MSATTITAVEVTLEGVNVSGADMRVYDSSMEAAQSMIELASHLKHRRSMVQSPDRHQHMCAEGCVCRSPTFNTSLQVVLAMQDHGDSLGPYCVDMEKNFSGLLVWDWRTCDSVDLSDDTDTVASSAPKTLNTEHFAFSDPFSGPLPVSVPGVNGFAIWMVPESNPLYQFSLQKEVDDSWHPIAVGAPEAGGEFCAICQTSGGAPTTRTPCGHSFHITCLEAWVQRKPVCPVCNQSQREQHQDVIDLS